MEAAAGPSVAGPPVTGLSCKVHSNGQPPGRPSVHQTSLWVPPHSGAQGRYRELTGNASDGHAHPVVPYPILRAVNKTIMSVFTYI